ncbi:MAG: anthranilate synthase component I family protein [Luteolibacter sp.]
MTDGLRRVEMLDGMAAMEVARGLSWMEGMVFFDTAGNVPESAGRAVSVISARPRGIYKGSVFSETDKGMLRGLLKENEVCGGDSGFPAGGLCGMVSYEGDFVFGDYREMLVRDEESGEWWETGGLSGELREVSDGEVSVGDFSEEKGREWFLGAVGEVKELIAAGDIYQVNLTQGFSADVVGEGSLLGLYEVLREVSPGPMGAWMELDGRELLSTSPELFLKISGKGIETRPIKGTRPRFSDPDEDMRSAVELQTSPKEVAELVMITDLLRNDLGQVCEFGTVEAREMLRLESLAQVHHLVSTVVGTLRDNDPVGALAACFPGGSITGAPKKRAMEIISEIEKKERGIYCGAMGWFGYNGESEFNIAIRTLVREGDTVRYQVGAGIVADSVAEEEYAETMQKGEGIRLGVERWRNLKL